MKTKIEPQKKAKELLDKYLTIFKIFGLKTPYNSKKWNKAKQCAIMCVNEMLEETKTIWRPNMNKKEVVYNQYWMDVLEELKNS